MSFAFRPYTSADRASCVALFTANTPIWFAAHEREQYEAFLDDEPERYFVMLDGDGAIAGAGGVAVEPERKTAWLTWGMVDPARHGHGLGKALLTYRLELLRANLRVERVCIDTSHLAAPFYEKHGFTTQRVIPDGYATGLHRHEMEIRFAGAALR